MQVNFYCSSGTKTESGLLNVVKKAATTGVDHVYYWRTVEMQLALLADEEDGEGQSTVDGDMYEQLFATNCLDSPDLRLKLEVDSQKDCEEFCSKDAQCEAYSFDLESGSCRLLESCDEQALSFTTSSARKINLSIQTGESKPPLSEASGYKHRLRQRCSGPSTQVAKAGQPEACEAFCNAEESCGAYTFDFKSGECTFHRWCGFGEEHTWKMSARKLKKGSSPSEESYQYIPNVMCHAETQADKVLRGMSANRCEAACTARPSCKAFSSNTALVCSLYQTCEKHQPAAAGLVGIKA